MAESLPELQCAFEELERSTIHGLARPIAIIMTAVCSREFWITTGTWTLPEPSAEMYAFVVESPKKL